MESTFDQWAEVYDSVYADVREDIPFYVEEATRAGGPVLELGCGTGRVTIPIAESGVDIVGLDFSSRMLDVVRRKLDSRPQIPGSLTLIQGDMRDFPLDLDDRFSLVIVPFNTFLSLLTVEDQIRTLTSVKRHLAPGGRLAFNVFVPDPDMLAQEDNVARHTRDVTDPRTGARYVVWNHSSFDNHNQIMSTRTIVEELDETGVVGKRLYRDFQLRYAYRWEMYHLLTSCGYEVLDLFGDFDRSPFDETSTKMVWVAAPGV